MAEEAGEGMTDSKKWDVEAESALQEIREFVIPHGEAESFIQRSILVAIERAYILGVQDERERCADVAKAYWKNGKNVYARQAGRAVESRIRAQPARESGDK